MNMIEKVERAMAKQLGEAVFWVSYLSQAKAAIEAMREPTEEMNKIGASEPIYHCWEIGGEFTNDESAGEIYSRMIDAALKED